MSEDVSKDFRHWLGIIRLKRAIVAIASKPKEAKNLISWFLTLCILKFFQQEFESIRLLIPFVPLFNKVQDVLLSDFSSPIVCYFEELRPGPDFVSNANFQLCC